MKRRRRPAPRTAFRRYEAVATTSVRPTRAATAARPKRDLRQAEALEIDRPRLVSASLVLLVVALGFWIGFGDSFYVSASHVTVSGQSRVPAEEILRGSQLLGLHVLWVNSSAVEATLLRTTPSLRAARVSCALPAHCTITVAEREPSLAWRWGQATLWIDQGGVVFPARGDMPDLVTVESIDAQPPQPGQRIEGDLLTAITAAAQALSDVRAYRYTAARGLEFTDQGGYQVYLGTGSNMSDRAAVWRALSADLAARGITPKYVDVRFPLAPYYEP